MSNLYNSFKQNLLKCQKNILLTKNAQYRFEDIDDFSAKLSCCLYLLGMKPGDRLAVQIEKSEYNLFLYLACLRSGFIYLPLNSAYTADELDYFFQDAKPKIIICDPQKEQLISNIKSADSSLIKTLDEQGLGSLTHQLNEIQHENYPIYSARSDEIAVILYTSGTTGKPKGAMLTHQALLCNALDLIKIWEITDQDTILHMLPLFHVHGLFFAFHTALLSGASIILLPRFDVNLFFEYLSQSTVFMGVPTYYIRLLKDARLNHESCEQMRLFISGSAPLLSSTFEEFAFKTGHTLLERYGMTETGINASNPFNGLRKVGTVGKPLSTVHIRVVNNHNDPVPLNEVGHIQIKGNNLFKGYWMDLNKTKEDFTDDAYFKTGDLGAWDEEGYLSIVGRSKDMVITGGLNVYPKELEVTIDDINGVAESAIIGIPHPDLGEAVIAVVVADLGVVKEQHIIETIKQHHAGYKCPKKIFFVDHLPKNVMGKVQKNILREQFNKKL
jgi:malonyl-CoA/methylmalonyl-CoA synthetase